MLTARTEAVRARCPGMSADDARLFALILARGDCPGCGADLLALSTDFRWCRVCLRGLLLYGPFTRHLHGRCCACGKGWLLKED